jgi:AraC-like DNA-binding protein
MEKQKIQQARDIMLERMMNPPSLVELSRTIGLNDNKLKIGFKELYGTTVFGYLREKRLEKAFLLLQQGDLNVNETSLTVGYSNPSYFTEAFRNKYGVNPGNLRRRSF